MKLAKFEGANVRMHDEDNKTWYSVIDIIAILTESPDPGAYWRQLKKKLKEEGSETVTNSHTFKLMAKDGKMRNTDCLIREDVLRLVQSVSSPKAEPFKLWLANAGEQIIAEQEDPNIMIAKLYDYYTRRGMTGEWIKNRIRGGEIRKMLTDYWKAHGVDGSDYAILTNEISLGTFDISVQDHKTLKEIGEKDNLRDNFTNLELIFQSLSEELVRQVAERDGADGFNDNIKAAKEGSSAAGLSRQRLEKQLGIKVVSNSNNLLNE